MIHASTLDMYALNKMFNRCHFAKIPAIFAIITLLIVLYLAMLYQQDGKYTTQDFHTHSADDGLQVEMISNKNLADDGLQFVMISNKNLSVPLGLRRTEHTDISIERQIEGLDTVTSVAHWYNRYCDANYIECEHRTRLGRSVDGGWNTCIAAPYRPRESCLVYSFGINNDWSFDEAISKRYGCTVRAFDPSIGLEAHEHSPGVHFYPYGLGGMNEVNARGWNMKTFRTITEELGDDEKIIDYLKIDIESSEWSSFATMFEEHALDRVKQLSFEAHAGIRADMGPNAWGRVTTVYKQLDRLGFKKWYTDYNMHTTFNSMIDGNDTWSVYGREMGYLNMNFLTPGYME